jgi:hypothetical protein
MDDVRCVTPGLGENPCLIASHGGAVLGDPHRLALSGGRRGEQVAPLLCPRNSCPQRLPVRGPGGAPRHGRRDRRRSHQGGYAFTDVKLAEDDAIEVGALRCIALETPGHTREPTSSAVHEDTAPDPAVVRTGGSLSIGSAGRTAPLGGGPYALPHPGALSHSQRLSGNNAWKNNIFVR